MHEVEKITVGSYSMPNMGPYPRCLPRLNTVRFTETQVPAGKRMLQLWFESVRRF